MKHRASTLLSMLLLTAALGASAAPATAGELLIPLSAGTAPDGTAYTTRVWVSNTGTVERRLTYKLIAPGTDGSKATGGGSVTIPAGDTVLATNLAPAGQSGMLLVSGAPQLLVTPRLEGSAPNGSLRAAAAGPLVSASDLTPARGMLHLHGLSQKQGGLSTDLSLINASRQAAQCTVDALRDNGSQLGNNIRLTLPPLSVRVFERALAAFGASNIDEARFAISCDQAFYGYARVYKPGGGELNVVTPAQALGN